MTPDLPDDVLFHITEKLPDEHHPESRQNLHNLALTCRRLHWIATPAMHRSLSFCVDLGYPECAMVGLIRDLTRARSLLQSPQRLRHVRRLKLQNWDINHVSQEISAQYFSPEDDRYNPVDAVNARNFISAIYDTITCLVLHMPQLQELELLQSPITPLLHSAMSSCPRLISFCRIHNFVAEVHTQSPIDPPKTLHIQKLKYHSQQKNTRTDKHLSHILDQRIMNLHALSITSIHLPLLASHIHNRTLPLKTLDVEFLHWALPLNDDVTSALWNTLRATPDLRTLLITGNGLEIRPPDDLRNHLDNLFQICASHMTIQKLAEVTELRAVQINESFHIRGLSIARIIPCSPTHLREITLNGVENATQQELDNFIRSFHVFQSLEYLSIDLQRQTPGNYSNSWKVMKTLWKKLNHLRSFNLHCDDWDSINDTYGILVSCPLDITDGPLVRGHPTLERIAITFLCDTLWEWDGEHGWVSRPWSSEAWPKISIPSWSEV